MKIWELHARRLDAIRSAPGGDADVAGLLFSEKAYLLALQEFRPEALVELVEGQTPAGAAETLIRHFSAAARPLVASRVHTVEPRLCRSDEVTASNSTASAGARQL